MSYYCEISFKQIGQSEVLPFLGEFKKCVTQHLVDIAKDNYSYCPYIRAQDLKPLSKPMSREEWQALPAEEKANLFPHHYRNVDQKDLDMARYWARSSVFQYRYIYDTERQLLGLFGVHDSVQHLFDKTVPFQNSCDQDYSRSHWEGIAAFEAIFDKWDAKPDEAIVKAYFTRHGYSLYDDYDIKDASTPEKAAEILERKLGYYRRDFAYDEIWSSYQPALYNDEDCVYISLYGPYDMTAMNKFIKACHDCAVEWKEEGEREYFEVLLGRKPDMERVIEHHCGPINRNSEFASFLATHPGWFDKYPQYKEAYDNLNASVEANPLSEEIETNEITE